jgi:hypothetical protein
MEAMHEGFDGQKQRTALTAAEQALRALGAGNAAKARKTAAQAAALDQIGIYSGFAAAVAPLADRLDGGEAVDDAGWDRLVETLGLGPLSGLIDELRS